MKNGLIHNTPVEVYNGIWVKREDLCSPSPGPEFSKYRGVVEHIAARPESVIGVLDTFHSKAGIAVAYACSFLGKRCVNFWPRYKGEIGLRRNQEASASLGAELYELQAGRSAILHHRARRALGEYPDSYLMPNALKLAESVRANADEARITDTSRFSTIILPASSGTIAAGVISGVLSKRENPRFVIHMGYSRPQSAVENYIRKFVPAKLDLLFIDEGYSYKDAARKGAMAPFPANPYYDLKSWDWLMRFRDQVEHRVLFWNIGA